MANVEEAQEVLSGLGLPDAQQNEISALTLLALCGLGPEDSWTEATKDSNTITKGVMAFIKERFGKEYAPNTRETFRRQVLHQFVQARIADYNPDDPNLPTNSPRAHYALSEAAFAAIAKFGTIEWEKARKRFVAKRGALVDVYRMERKTRMVPVRLPGGRTLELSPGKHNEVQALLVKEFAPRFAPGATVLYLGDTAKKNLHLDEESLSALGVPMNEHDKLPDVVIHDKRRDWLFLIEAVTSHGPMTPKRVVELKKLFSKCTAGLVFVSAFPSFGEFRKHLNAIAWETEVWIAEIPDHMIHYNGDRFLGPR